MDVAGVELAASSRNAQLRVPHEDAEEQYEENLKPDGEQWETRCLQHAVVVDARRKKLATPCTAVSTVAKQLQ